MTKLEYRAQKMGMSVNEYNAYVADKDKALNAMAHMVEISQKIDALVRQHQKYYYQLREAMQNERVREDITSRVVEKYGHDPRFFYEPILLTGRE